MLEGRDREAAAVAERLKAFLADPRRAAPRYLEGAEPLPDGGIVLRLAQGKVPAGIGEPALVQRAAQHFVRRVCLFERADHYQVLCAARDAPPESIKENYHLLMSLLHPDRQEGAEETWPGECAQRVNLAYAALGDAEARREYDARLRAKHPRFHVHRASAGARRQMNEVRYAQAMIGVTVIVAAALGAGLLIHDDEWGDRSLLETAIARLRVHTGTAAASSPRYVGASTAVPSHLAGDGVGPGETKALEMIRPLVRVLDDAVEPKPWAPTPTTAAAQAPAPVAPAAPAAAAPAPINSLAVAEPVRTAMPVRVAAIDAAPSVIAQNAPSSLTADSSLPTNQEVESLVVALIAHYEAGDAERLMDLVDMGWWRKAQSRSTYSEFFRATKSRRLRLDRLAWNATDGTLKVRGQATVQAEYFDRIAPLERHVDVEMDIVERDGKARLTRLSLFPEAR